MYLGLNQHGYFVFWSTSEVPEKTEMPFYMLSVF